MMRAFFQNLTERERGMLIGGGALVVFLLVYLLGVMPLRQSEDRAARALAAEQARFYRVADLIARGRRLRGTDPLAQTQTASSVRSAITELAKQQNISISRLQPGSDGQLGVWFNDVAGGDFFRWLAALETQYGLKAEKISLTPNHNKQTLRAQASFTEVAE